jgi:bleomycin hydrolase
MARWNFITTANAFTVSDSIEDYCTMQHNITPDDLVRFSAAFDVDPKNRLAANAVAQNDISAVALKRESINRINHTYSHLIEKPEATRQGKTGRCWIFAGLNVLRLATIQKLNLKMEKFELSQPYLMYWDKLEKAHFFLENIIETRDEPPPSMSNRSSASNLFDVRPFLDR